MQYDTGKLYTDLTVPSSTGVRSLETSTVVLNIGTYVFALSMDDGPLGGEVAGDAGMIFLCPSIGPHVCQVSPSSLRAFASIPEGYSRNTRLGTIFHESSSVVQVAFLGFVVL